MAHRNGNVNIDEGALAWVNRYETATDLVVGVAKDTIKEHPKKFSVWVMGLLILAFGTGLAVTTEQKQKHDHYMNQASKLLASSDNIRHKVVVREQAYRASKGWFSCDRTCTANYEALLKAQEELDAAMLLVDEEENKARREVGIFSEYGVADCRKIMWRSWEWGKAYAKRMTWWDATWTAMGAFTGRNRRRRDDDDTWVRIAQFVLKIIWNFTVGMTFALIGFLWKLIWFVRAFQAGPAGALFFVLAAIAVISGFVLYLMSLFTVGGAVTYQILKQSPNFQREIRMQQGGQRQRFVEDRRPHWQ